MRASLYTAEGEWVVTVRIPTWTVQQARVLVWHGRTFVITDGSSEKWTSPLQYYEVFGYVASEESIQLQERAEAAERERDEALASAQAEASRGDDLDKQLATAGADALRKAAAWFKAAVGWTDDIARQLRRMADAIAKPEEKPACTHEPMGRLVPGCPGCEAQLEVQRRGFGLGYKPGPRQARIVPEEPTDG